MQAWLYIQAKHSTNVCLDFQLKNNSLLYTQIASFMESSVYLLNHCSTLSVPLFRFPSTVNAARATRPNLRLLHVSTPMGLSSRPVKRLLTPIVCGVDVASTPPTNNKGDGNILKWASMAVVGALGALISSRQGNRDQPADKANKLMELINGGKGNIVPNKLKEMYQKNPDEVYFVGMELIKIIVSRAYDMERFRVGVTIGGLLEDLCGEPNSFPLKKGDLFLYMALMNGMIGEAVKAESWWNKFKSLSEESSTLPPLPPSAHED